VLQCARSFEYCSRRWFKILTKDSRLVNIKAKPAQKEVVSRLLANHWLYVLKSRQIGVTTILACLFFWMALFRPGYRVLVVAHKAETAEEIFQIFKRLYQHLPTFLQFEIKRENLRDLTFFHGGRIRVTTAGSDMGAGTTWNAILGTEFARWKRISAAIEALLQTAAPNAYVVFDTTSIGLNEAHRVWTEDNGYNKYFTGWLDEGTYTRKDPPPGGPDGPGTFYPHEREYIKAHKLRPERANWYAHTLRTKCTNSQVTFDQAYPVNADVAWVTAGARYFTRLMIAPSEPPEDGLRIFEAPQPFAVYSAGIDTGSGSGLDSSTVVIKDVTDTSQPRTVLTLQLSTVRQIEFARQAYKYVSQYRALAVIELTGGYGGPVQEYFEAKEYDHLWVRTQFDKLGQKTVDKLGWMTSEQTRPGLLATANDLLATGKWDPVDDRIKTQINTFVFNPRGKPEHSSGRKDDLVLASAMALKGMDQIDAVVDDVQKHPNRPPTSFQEMAQWESRTGNKWDATEGGAATPPSMLVN